MREIYRQKGYSADWIEKRVRGIAIRDELNDEWKKRGVKEQRDFAILTAEISKATFGLTPAEYRDFKSLTSPKDNLRDHTSALELIFTMLGEASTTEIARKRDAQGSPRTGKLPKLAAPLPATPAANSKPRAVPAYRSAKISEPLPNPHRRPCPRPSRQPADAMPLTFDAFFQKATGHPPYAYQRRLAGALAGPAPSGPFPCSSELISIPTSLGKTAA
jgi:hypothetical protein